MLVLIMSSKSTSHIGRVMWDENPTLAALVKMIVSNRYRFPTVDCDEVAREAMKRAEQAARDVVSLQFRFPTVPILFPLNEWRQCRRQNLQIFSFFPP